MKFTKKFCANIVALALSFVTLLGPLAVGSDCLAESQAALDREEALEMPPLSESDQDFPRDLDPQWVSPAPLWSPPRGQVSEFSLLRCEPFHSASGV